MSRELNPVRPFRSSAGAGVLLTVAMAVGGMSPASGATLDCGDVLTTDTVLQADLLGCPGNGLVVGADDVTLNLNGHTISGDGLPDSSCPVDVQCDVGIDNAAGHRGLTLLRGSVRNFSVG